MNLEWRQRGPGQWELVELPRWNMRTRAQVYSYRHDGQRVIEAHILPQQGYQVLFRVCESVKEAKAWAVAMCQLSQ